MKTWEVVLKKSSWLWTLDKYIHLGKLTVGFLIYANIMQTQKWLTGKWQPTGIYRTKWKAEGTKREIFPKCWPLFGKVVVI